MIRGDVLHNDSLANQDKSFVFTARNASALSRELTPGSVVRVTVLSALGDGTARVRIGERILVAAGLHHLSEGESFNARISIVDNAVLVTPERERITVPTGNAALFRSLGMSETPVSLFVVSFFKTIGMCLDPKLLRSVLAAAIRFPTKELRAAEAAAILVERGIVPDDATVDRMLRILEGAGSGDGRQGAGDEPSTDDRQGGADDRADVIDDATDRDFCAFVNHKKGQALHWIVLPFRKELADTPCTGSIRFLLDTSTGRTTTSRPTQTRATCCRMTVLDGTHDWDFSLDGQECMCTANPVFPSVVFDQLVVYLKRQLENSGITTITVLDPGSFPVSDIKSIDLEI